MCDVHVQEVTVSFHWTLSRHVSVFDLLPSAMKRLLLQVTVTMVPKVTLSVLTSYHVLGPERELQFNTEKKPRSSKVYPNGMNTKKNHSKQ